MENLLMKIGENSYKVLDYADDLSITITGKCHQTLLQRMEFIYAGHLNFKLIELSSVRTLKMWIVRKKEKRRNMRNNHSNRSTPQPDGTF